MSRLSPAGRPNEVDRLLAGLLPSRESNEGYRNDQEYCDGEPTCMAIHHSVLCRAAGDPLRTSGSLRARRVG